MENKMTPTPWRIRHLRKDDPESEFFIEADKTNKKAGYNIEIMGSEDGPNYEYGQKKADANAIVTAINSTYGQGIDPSSVPDLLDALEKIVAIATDRWRPLPVTSHEKNCLSSARAAIKLAKSTKQ